MNQRSWVSILLILSGIGATREREWCRVYYFFLPLHLLLVLPPLPSRRMALSLVNQYHPLLPVQPNKPSSSSSAFEVRHFRFQPKLKFLSLGIRCSSSTGSAFTDKTLVSIKPNNLNHVPNDDTLACRFHTAQYGAQESNKSYVEAYAIGRNIRMSADKARRVIDQIRGRSYEETLTILELMPYRACEAIIKIVFSAGANASNNLGLSKGSLIISKAEVNEGKTMKRIRPQSRGRAYPIRKRTCHIAITVRGLPSKSVVEANPA